MRAPLVTGSATLKARLNQPGQVDATAAEAGMPPYMESFLAHLRLLVGVPFEYLIPDPRLLPDESIRFFYLDRSWTDRLVDGSVTVGKIGSREQAHHHAHGDAVSRNLDVSERMVRSLQRGRDDFAKVREQVYAKHFVPTTLVTGFLMRSGAVSGWPHMDVRAYSERLGEPFDVASPSAVAKQLPLLRLERLSPGVLFALFIGVPALVTLEEPHHGVQFGIDVSPNGSDANVPLRSATGQLLSKGAHAINLPVPRRRGAATLSTSIAYATNCKPRQRSKSTIPGIVRSSRRAVQPLPSPCSIRPGASVLKARRTRQVTRRTSNSR